jgi:hypothetical protein
MPLLVLSEEVLFSLTLALSQGEREPPSPFGRRAGDEGEAALLMGG